MTTTDSTTGRRVHERFECDLPAQLHTEDGDAHAVIVSNLSLGGAYLLTEFSPPYGAKCRLKVQLSAIGQESEIDVTVRWSKPDGLGVQFGMLRATEVWALNQLFKKLPSAGL